jgi:hypothetical protein
LTVRRISLIILQMGILRRSEGRQWTRCLICDTCDDDACDDDDVPICVFWVYNPR